MSGLSENMLSCPMKIIEYSSQYRDDMIFMVLEAKNALGRIPHLNEVYWIFRGIIWIRAIPFILR